MADNVAEVPFLAGFLNSAPHVTFGISRDITITVLRNLFDVSTSHTVYETYLRYVVGFF